MCWILYGLCGKKTLNIAYFVKKKHINFIAEKNIINMKKYNFFNEFKFLNYYQNNLFLKFMLLVLHNCDNSCLVSFKNHEKY